MKPEDQIKALAELDGRLACTVSNCGCGSELKDFNYLTSYDAIIPLIQRHQRQGRKMALKITGELWNMKLVFLFQATPSQLCEALLRATGKWKE